MIRIRVHEAEEQLTIHVEGQLAGIFTNELERCWRCMDAGTYGKVVLDLDGVIHIDRAGRDLLRSMHRNGVRFAGARLAMQDVLDEVMEVDRTDAVPQKPDRLKTLAKRNRNSEA
jgi:anti-anti-sigma regulatory factor